MGRFAGDYSPDQYVITLGSPVGQFGADLSAAITALGVLPSGFSFPFTLTGYAPGTFFGHTRETQSATKTTGTDGEVVRNRMLNRSATFTFTLMHSALANTLLSAYMLAFENGINLTFPVNVTDLLSAPRTQITAPECWVQGWPEESRADAEGSFAWSIDTSESRPFFGSRTR